MSIERIRQGDPSSNGTGGIDLPFSIGLDGRIGENMGETQNFEQNTITMGRSFREQAHEQIGKALHGEQEAIDGYLAAGISGSNVVLLGKPGVGKSVLLRDAIEIYGPTGEHDIKRIPPQSDLTGKEITGGAARSSKTTLRNEEELEEHFETVIAPILHPEVRVIVADELNRANPLAIAAMFEGLESGKVITNDGVVELPNLEFAIAAVNPRGVDKTVFPMSPALVSRLAIGAAMGVNPNDQDRIVEKALTKNLSDPQAIEQVSSFNELRKLRAIAESKEVPGEELTRGKQIIKATLGLLDDNNVAEGIGRMSEQIVDVASALAVLNGNQHVHSGDILQAARYYVTSRLGSLETQADPYTEFNRLKEDINATDEELESWYNSHTHPAQ